MLLKGFVLDELKIFNLQLYQIWCVTYVGSGVYSTVTMCLVLGLSRMPKKIHFIVRVYKVSINVDTTCTRFFWQIWVSFNWTLRLGKCDFWACWMSWIRTLLSIPISVCCYLELCSAITSYTRVQNYIHKILICCLDITEHKWLWVVNITFSLNSYGDA